MIATNDGGPAFPLGPTATTVTPNTDGRGHIATYYGMEPGLTIRDYFAAAAINEVGWHNDINKSAAMAYTIADAMLKAREANP